MNREVSQRRLNHNEPSEAHRIRFRFTLGTRFRRNALLALALAITLAIVFAFVAWLPPLLVTTRGLTADQLAEHIDSARTAVLQALAGVGLFAGLFYTASTFRLNREGQLTERFSKAVDQIGS